MESFAVLMIIFGVLGIIILMGISKSVRKKAKYTKNIKSRSSDSTPQSDPPRYRGKSKILEWLKSEIMENNANVLRLSKGYQIKIPRGHKYDLFSAIKITQESKRTIKIVGILTKVIPSYLDIRNSKTFYGSTKDSFSVFDLDRDFKLYSTAPDMWREIFTNSKIKDLLQNNSLLIQHYYLRGEYMEALMSHNQVGLGTTILSLTILIHEELKKLFGILDSTDVEKLVCYNCQDPFDPLEEKCDKCGSSRPRCIVCLLDLYPSDIERDVVTTPCCGVYAHKDHIIKWLKQDPRCPNCHKNISHWLGQLQIS
ncbi:MAG: E3 ubiquitin protein ligase [Candidatus Heimdallarchaeota archaeon]|nr:E3 ubiquitin protein ligase [Candidatus Heimdallarchaeota archaeon]MCK4254048.1 E3 ubiquitin protein ligase [Candidatus Heimdallarchaeota archaeon]